MGNQLNRLHEILNQSLDLLDEACELVASAGIESPQDTVKILAVAIGNILHARRSVYEVDPSLRSPDK